MFLKKLLSQKLILTVSALILVILCLYPFLVLFGKITFPAPLFEFDLKYYFKVFESKSTLLALKNTVFISLGTAMVSTILALPLSWVLTRTNLANAGKWRSLFCLPYAIPPYIGAMAWIYLANPTNGLLNIILGKGFLNIYSQLGLMWVMSCFFYTFILLSLLASLDRMDPSLEEAARISGASPFKVFTQITIPIIFP